MDVDYTTILEVFRILQEFGTFKGVLETQT